MDIEEYLDEVRRASAAAQKSGHNRYLVDEDGRIELSHWPMGRILETFSPIDRDLYNK